MFWCYRDMLQTLFRLSQTGRTLSNYGSITMQLITTLMHVRQTKKKHKQEKRRFPWGTHAGLVSAKLGIPITSRGDI